MHGCIRQRRTAKASQEEGQLEIKIKASNRLTRQTCGPERLKRDLLSMVSRWAFAESRLLEGNDTLIG